MTRRCPSSFTHGDQQRSSSALILLCPSIGSRWSMLDKATCRACGILRKRLPASTGLPLELMYPEERAWARTRARAWWAGRVGLKRRNRSGGLRWRRSATMRVMEEAWSNVCKGRRGRPKRRLLHMRLATHYALPTLHLSRRRHSFSSRRSDGSRVSLHTHLPVVEMWPLQIPNDRRRGAKPTPWYPKRPTPFRRSRVAGGTSSWPSAIMERRRCLDLGRAISQLGGWLVRQDLARDRAHRIPRQSPAATNGCMHGNTCYSGVGKQ